MDETKRQKIKHFLSDPIMSGAVREVFTKMFLKPKGNQDVHTLAASRIAIDLLDEAYKELAALSAEEPQSEKRSTNPGL